MNYAINLVDLDKEALKQNLIDYLKSTDIGKQYDLDSDGTAMKMLVDLFSYNTLIWLHYLHVVNKESFISTAQRNDSISKLLQVVGFTPQNSNSSLSLVTFNKTSGTIAKIDKFAIARGKNRNSGIYYNFYYLGDTLTLDTTTTLPFYAGDSLVKNLPITIDENQEYKINDSKVDIRTICVSVNGVYWTNYTNNPIQNTDVESKIFFTVKKGNNYYIKFGKNYQDQNINSIGKSVELTDAVLLSYVVSSGSRANDTLVNELVSNDSSPLPTNITVTSNISRGGFDNPDLEYLKYIAPRYYGYNALVTKSDIEAAIISSGYLTSYTDINNKISVFDGQNYNNNYGKIYFSIIDLGVEDENVTAIKSILQNKAIYGLSIEYQKSQNFTGSITITGSRDTKKTNRSVTQIRNDYEKNIEDAYGTSRFNNSLSKSDLIILASETDPGLSVKDSNITITLSKTLDLDIDKTVYFYNGITSFETELVSTNLSTSKVKFKSTSVNVPELNGFKYIGAYLTNNALVNDKVGVFNPTSGFIMFYDTVDPSEEFDITITPSVDSINPINNMAVAYEVNTITIT